MTNGRGATIVWTSYNYPSQVTNAGLSSSFYYTPDRQYYKQVADYSNGTATTIYIGGLLEKVTTAAGTDYRHSIHVGSATIVVSRQTGGINTTNYATSDQLGSSSAITNSSGAIVVNASFDAFGRRRGSNWSGAPSVGDWSAIASTTRRGYTGHTMLDNVDLIHMNGRVYDPMIARFASADLFIPHTDNTQSYNRYSYVRNNPLTLWDPSGFKDKLGKPKSQNGGAATPTGRTRRGSGNNLWDYATNYGASPWVSCSGFCLPNLAEVLRDGRTDWVPLKFRPTTHLFTDSDGYEFTIDVVQIYLGDIFIGNYHPADNSIAYGDSGIKVEWARQRIFSEFGSFGMGVAAGWADGASRIKDESILIGAGELGGTAVTAAWAYRAALAARGGKALGLFSKTVNASGGEVWQSTGTIVQSDFAPIVNDAIASGKRVNILSGVHGHLDGRLEGELGFLDDDIARWGGSPNVSLFDIKSLPDAQIRGMLNSADVTVGAFCNSALCLARYW